MPTRTNETIPSDGEAWELPESATMRLPRRRSATVVRVVRGTVLVTQEGDLEDHVLESGDEIVLRVGGLAVAWAFTDAVISVREASPTGSKLRPSAGWGLGTRLRQPMRWLREP